MIRSMCTAISSLNLNQTYLDVISDNLANSNTTGFKSSRVIFQDQFAQIMTSGAAPIGEVGGINPTEVGLGVKLGYVSPTFTQGMMQSTGKSTDLAIQGNGFFIYTNGQTTTYSREGSLEIDADGYLVNNSTGMRIMGWTITPGSTTTIDTNQPIGSMQISLDATIARATSTASLTGNLDSGTDILVAHEDATLDDATIGASYTVALDDPTTASDELADGDYTLRTVISGTTAGGFTFTAQLVDSDGENVGDAVSGVYSNTTGADIPLGTGLTFTIEDGLAVDGVPQTITSGAVSYEHSVAAVAAGTIETTIAVYDSLGDSHTPTIRFTRTDEALVWNWAVTNPADAEGNGTITFNSDGTYNSSLVINDVVIQGSAGALDVEMTLDLNSITMLSADNTIAASSQDGLAAGSVSELYGAPNTGEMYLVYSNGLKQLCGQLSLAFFTNPSGLLRSGGNQYKIGLNSGEPQIGTANTGGRGSISSGYLEASNVDIAQEFTNMILAQRSFQASARVITTSDQILQELVNLKQ